MDSTIDSTSYMRWVLQGMLPFAASITSSVHASTSPRFQVESK